MPAICMRLYSRFPQASTLFAGPSSPARERMLSRFSLFSRRGYSSRYDESMNKAFLKEPEQGDARCPQCHAPGVAVDPGTLPLFVPAAALSRISESAWYCPAERCPVAYFDLFERSVPASELLRPVYPKMPDAPLCGCFGLTEDDIRQDLDEGTVQRVRTVIERSRGPEARCAVNSPTGHSCVSEVQRCYMRLRGQ